MKTRLPARRPLPGVVERHLDFPATSPSDGSWVEAAIAYHAAAAGGIADCIADEAAFDVGQVLGRHGLISATLHGDDLRQVRDPIRALAAQLLRERMIRRMGAIEGSADGIRAASRRDLVLALLTEISA